MTKNVLLVDDNRDLRYSVVQGLRSANADIKIIEADSGKSALKILKTTKIDAILLDIMMPEMDGWDVAEALKSDNKTKDIPLLFLTAKTDDFNKNMGRKIAEDYIEKPFNPIDLKRRIEKLLIK